MVWSPTVQKRLSDMSRQGSLKLMSRFVAFYCDTTRQPSNELWITLLGGREFVCSRHMQGHIVCMYVAFVRTLKSQATVTAVYAIFTISRYLLYPLPSIIPKALIKL